MKSLASKPKEPPSCSTFQVKARLYVNFIAVRILFVFFAVTILKYHSLNWEDVSVTNVDIFEKKLFSLQFVFSLPQLGLHSVQSLFYFSPKCLLVSVCTKGFAYFALLTAGKGNRTPGMYAEIFRFMNFTNFCYLIFYFFIFWKKFFFFTHDIQFTHTHTHDRRPLLTTHYPRHI